MKFASLKLLACILMFALPTCAFCDDGSFHIYAPSRSTQELIVIKASSNNGTLSLKLGTPVKLDFPPATIAAHSSKPLLYVVPPRDNKTGETFGAVINVGAGYQRLQQSPLKLHHGYSYLSIDRSAKFLLGASYFGGFVDVYSLAENGTPIKRVAALNEGRKNAHCVLVSPDNNFVYIPYVKETNAIFQYRFDSTSGSLAALEPKNAQPPKGTGPRHMAYHPKLPIVYFSNEQNLGVSVYDKHKNGQLKVKQVCDLIDPNESKDGVSSSDIAITPDGRFLFAGVRGHKRDFDWISRYQIQPNGEVRLLGKTPADKIPWGLTLSPDSKYLIASAFQGETITAYRIGKDGSLKKAASIKCPKQISDLVTR
jgi:6-phosphogluconolactonase